MKGPKVNGERAESDGLLEEIATRADAAVEKWGAVAQERMISEEAAELIVAVARFGRGRGTAGDVATEAADAIIVAVEAARLAHVPTFVLRREIARKLARLDARLKEDSYNG